MSKGLGKWAGKHPFLATIIVLSAIGGIEYVIRGPQSIAMQKLGLGTPPTPTTPPPAQLGGGVGGSSDPVTYVIAYAWDGKGWIRKDASWKTSGAIQAEQSTIGNGAYTWWAVWLPSKAAWLTQLVPPGGAVNIGT